MTERPRHLPLMLVLTFSTGVVDAVGFLGLDRVFTGNMTGNVVILGMALAGAADLPVLGPVLALLGFLVGAAGAGCAVRPTPGGWSGRTTMLLALVAATLTGLAVWTLVQPPSGGAVQAAVTGLLGGAMGVQAGAARHVGVRDVTTVVVTSALTALAAESRLGNGRGAQPVRRAGAVAAILAGAAVGALLVRQSLAAGLLLSAGLTAVVAVAGHVDLLRAGRSAPAATAGPA